MEKWDLFDRERRPLGRPQERGQPLEPGCNHLVVAVCVVDGRGRMLLTLRDKAKPVYPNCWENTGGAVLAGETSLEGALRELREETGLAAQPEALRLLDTAWGTSSAVDIYLYAMAGTAQIRLQPGETADYRWVSLEELAGMMDAGLIAAPIVPRLRQVWHALKAAMTEAPGFSG